jgi:hypothetical protein
MEIGREVAISYTISKDVAVSSALTSANAVWVPWYLQRSSDHDCPCLTVVGRSLSHADRTSCHGAPVLRAASSGTWRHDRLTSTTLPAGCTIKPPDAGSRQCPWVTALLNKQLSSSNPSGSWPKLTPTGQHAWRDTNRSSGACSNACARTGSNRSATRSPSLLTRKMEISWARGSGPWPSAPVRACGGVWVRRPGPALFRLGPVRGCGRG